MNTKLKTLDEVNTFIEKANALLGYPNSKGTETYCDVPEPVDNIYNIPITYELIKLMINKFTIDILNNTF